MFFSSFYSPYLQQNVGYLVTLSNTPGRNFSVIHYNWMLGSISYFFFWWHQMALITLTSLTFNSLQSLMIISVHWMLAATVKTIVCNIIISCESSKLKYTLHLYLSLSFYCARASAATV